jgi:hypothetical protein
VNNLDEFLIELTSRAVSIEYVCVSVSEREGVRHNHVVPSSSSAGNGMPITDALLD